LRYTIIIYLFKWTDFHSLVPITHLKEDLVAKKPRLKGRGEIYSQVEFITKVDYNLLLFETPSGQDQIKGFVTICDEFTGFTKPYSDTVLVLNDGRRLPISILETHHKAINPTYLVTSAPEVSRK
jgi:hypothetical protein